MAIARRDSLWLDQERYSGLLHRADPVAVMAHHFYRCLSVRDIDPLRQRKTEVLGYGDCVVLRDVDLLTRYARESKSAARLQLAEIRGFLADRDAAVDDASLVTVHFNPWQAPHFVVPGNEEPLLGAAWLTMTRHSMKVLNPIFG